MRSSVLYPLSCVICVLLLLALAACGGATETEQAPNENASSGDTSTTGGLPTLESIPVFPGAVEAPADDPIALAYLEQSSTPPEGSSSIEAQVFLLPTEAGTFADVESFYTENLPDWTFETSQTNEIPAETGTLTQEIALWTLDGTLLLVTLFANDTTESENYLVVAMAYE